MGKHQESMDAAGADARLRPGSLARLGRAAGGLLFLLVVVLYQVHLATGAGRGPNARVLCGLVMLHAVAFLLADRENLQRWLRGGALIPVWMAQATAVGVAVWLTGGSSSPFLFLLHLLVLAAALTAGGLGAAAAAALATAAVVVIAVRPPGDTGFALHDGIHLGVVLSSLWLVAYLGRRIVCDVASERRRLEKANETLAARFAESSLLYAFSHSLSSATSLEHLASAALDQVARVTGSRMAMLFLYHREADELAVEAVTGISESALAVLRRQSIGPDAPGVAGQVAFTREGLYIPDVTASGDLHARVPLAGLLGCRGVLAEPLVARGELIGVLEAVSATPLALTAGDLRLFRVLCNDLALSLENMRLAVEAQDRARIERLVNRISQRIQSTLDLATVMGTAVRELCVAVGASRCLIMRHQEGAPATVTHEYCQPGIEPVGVGREPAAGVCQRALVTDSTVICDDVLHDPDLSPEDREELLSLGTRAALATALRHRDQIFGAVTLHECGRPRQWRDADVALVETVAGQIAVGVENALLYEETRRKSEEISAKNRELEAFVYTASHDLRAPLVTIQGFASILLSDHGDALDEDAHFYLERIRTNTGRMERLIDDLLELSRAGRATGQFMDVPVGEVVAEALDALHARLREREVELVVADSWPTIACDRERLLQVFTNLVGNAVKFLGPDNKHPRIELGWCEREESAEFFVRDNGIGIEPDYHERIFAVFQRLNDLEGVEGTGVGLAIVKRIIDPHGGQVWVESSRGEGATFRFTLPWRREATS